MKSIWNYLEEKDWKASTKFRAFLFIEALICGLIGFAVWGVIQFFALSSIDWMICFIGYPVIFSWFAVFIYTTNNDFTDGLPEN